MTKQTQSKYAFKEKRERQTEIVHRLKPMDGPLFGDYHKLGPNRSDWGWTSQ
jgi:hypothetical protein